jgi:endonuclease G
VQKFFHVALVATLTSFLSSTSFALSGDFSACKTIFANSTPPVMQVLDIKPRALCFSGFAVMHSGKSRTPLYVAERLNKKMLSDAHKKRTDEFFADARLPRAERAELEDYRGSGYDRGHMAPAADMSTDESMAQCFSLANMVPQAPINNRKVWASIEKSTRRYIKRTSGDVYVITGPVFDAKSNTIGNNHVWVPKYLYKLVYDPSANKVWAHWIENSNDAQVDGRVSYQELVKRTGINFLPNLQTITIPEK